MCGEACLADGALRSIWAVPFVRASPNIHGPQAIPGAEPNLFSLSAGEASLAAHQAAEPLSEYFWGQSYLAQFRSLSFGSLGYRVRHNLRIDIGNCVSFVKSF